MATFTKAHTFTAGQVADPAAVNVNFDDIASFLNNQILHLDGSKAMTGILTLPASDPTGDNQATRKAYVDSVAKRRFMSTAGTVRQLAGSVAGQTDVLVDLSTKQPYLTGGTAVINTTANGDGTVFFPTPFPNGLITVHVTNGDATATTTGVHLSTHGAGRSSFNVRAYKGNGDWHANQSVRVNWIAIGY